MKRIVYLVLKSSTESVRALEEIRRDGYNATLISTESLRHALEDLPEERHFFNLRHVDAIKDNESIFCLFVVDDDKLEHLKDVVRRYTDHFHKINGFMFSTAIEDYEGSI